MVATPCDTLDTHTLMFSLTLAAPFIKICCCCYHFSRLILIAPIRFYADAVCLFSPCLRHVIFFRYDTRDIAFRHGASMPLRRDVFAIYALRDIRCRHCCDASCMRFRCSSFITAPPILLRHADIDALPLPMPRFTPLRRCCQLRC